MSLKLRLSVVPYRSSALFALGKEFVMNTSVRIERDAFGPIDVPVAALWGAQTQRSLHFFAISGERMPVVLIHALAEVKRACAVVNGELGLLAGDKAAAIIARCV